MHAKATVYNNYMLFGFKYVSKCYSLEKKRLIKCMHNCSRGLADATSQKVAIHSYVINLQKLPIAVRAHLLMDF